MLLPEQGSFRPPDNGPICLDYLSADIVNLTRSLIVFGQNQGWLPYTPDTEAYINHENLDDERPSPVTYLGEKLTIRYEMTQPIRSTTIETSTGQVQFDELEYRPPTTEGRIRLYTLLSGSPNRDMRLGSISMTFVYRSLENFLSLKKTEAHISPEDSHFTIQFALDEHGSTQVALHKKLWSRKRRSPGDEMTVYAHNVWTRSNYHRQLISELGVTDRTIERFDYPGMIALASAISHGAIPAAQDSLHLQGHINRILSQGS